MLSNYWIRRKLQVIRFTPRLDFVYIDNFALDVLRRPETYSVCVTSNAFGDILSDLLAYLEGGNGMAATGNFGGRKAMFEPLHGLQLAHQGKGTINPVAIHRCLAMMLSWLGERYANPTFSRASIALVAAIRRVLATGEVRTPDLQGTSSTSEMSDAIRRAFLEFAGHGEPVHSAAWRQGLHAAQPVGKSPLAIKKGNPGPPRQVTPSDLLKKGKT
jgi:isocitrate/isopropylmalate dehydrogenase